MKNVRTAITTIALTVVLSNSAMAGNIGLRTNNAINSPQQTEASVAGNIGLRNDSSVLGHLAIFIKGNIGLIVTVAIP